MKKIIALIAFIALLNQSAQSQFIGPSRIIDPCVFSSLEPTLDCPGEDAIVTITGPSPVEINDYDNYYINISGGTIYSTSYYIYGGTEITSSSTHVRVKWTSIGSNRYVRARVSTSSGVKTVYRYVTVNGTPPPAPPVGSISVSTNSCGNRTLTRSSPGPGFVSWYWQTSSSGTSRSSSASAQSVTLTSSGTRYLRAYDSNTGLWSTSSRSSGHVNVVQYPSTYTVSGGGNTCEVSNPIRLSGSQLGVRYQLRRNGQNVGSSIQGNGSSINFGVHSTPGTYDVRATRHTLTASCGRTMSGSASVTSSPPITPNVSVSSNTCGPKTITQIINPGQPIGFWQTSPTGQSISNSAIEYTVNASGTYYLRSKSSLGCWSTARTIPVNVNLYPDAYALTGGGSYCEGEGGLPIGLTDSQSGVNYQLIRNGNVVTTIAGTGGPISFGNQSFSGTYSAKAVNATSNCETTMSGSKTISILAKPQTFNVYKPVSNESCYAINNVRLDGNQVGFIYRLRRDGIDTGDELTSNGNPIVFSGSFGVGEYTIVALHPTTGCEQLMNDKVTVHPRPNTYSITSERYYCTGGSNITLDNSDIGVNYILEFEDSYVMQLSGTGSSLDFGNHGNQGTYTINAINEFGCSVSIGSTYIAPYPPDPRFNVTGGGVYCSGEGGRTISLSYSYTNFDYQLEKSNVNIGVPVRGTGGPLDFGLQTEGSYTVKAINTTTGCETPMNGVATVQLDDSIIPTDFSVMGGGSYCEGGSGRTISLSDSETGISYQLLLDGTEVRSPITGTGATLNWDNLKAEGMYTIIGSIPTRPLCGQTLMSGSATITIVDNPIVFDLLGGGLYCFGESPQVVLSDSEVDVTYQLVRRESDGTQTNINPPQQGTGEALIMLHSVGNTRDFFVRAHRGSCASQTELIAIRWTNTPDLHSFGGGGQYCPGDPALNFSMSGSSIVTEYQLYRDGMAVGSPILGDGNPINFPSQTEYGTYTVEALKLNNGCTATMNGSGAVIPGPTCSSASTSASIESDKNKIVFSTENDFDELSLYPNPANEILFVQSQGLVGSEVAIYNLNGQVLYRSNQVESTKYEINTSSIPNGVYLIRIKSDVDVIERKLLINH